MSLNQYTSPGVTPVSVSRLSVTDVPIGTAAGAITLSVSDVLKGQFTAAVGNIIGAGVILTLPTAAILVSDQLIHGVKEGACFPITIRNGDTTNTIQLLNGTNGTLDGVGIYTVPLTVTKNYIIRISDVTPGSEAYVVYDVTSGAN